MEKKKDEKEHFSFQTDIWFHKILKNMFKNYFLRIIF